MNRKKLSLIVPVFFGLAGLGNLSVIRADQLTVPLFEDLGNYHYPITTDSSLAQRYFDQGLILTYGFNHAEAARSFKEAARLDPDCAMAHWGAAFVLGSNINASMDKEAIPKAYSELQKALELASYANEKEQALIRALSNRYSPKPVQDRTSLEVAYVNAMREVAQRFADDVDVATLYAEALMNLNPWNYWTNDGQPQPGTPEILSTLESALKQNPNHPGANHLYIHAVEASPNPERGLPSADRLRDLVPGIGHLVHMPSHIYIRTGRYHDASLTNEKAIKVDEAYIRQYYPEGIYPLAYYTHNFHFLWAAATMEGRSQVALQAARDLASKVDREKMREPGFGTLQHFFSIPLFALISFGKWNEILKQPAPGKDLLYPNGVWHYARGMAYTRTGQLEAAAHELEQLKRIASDRSLEQVTIWEINTTSDLLEIAQEVLAGELAAKRGDYDKAVKHLEKGPRLQDDLTFDEPPSWLPSVRQSLGAILLEAGRSEEAEGVYHDELKRFPESGWSLFGLHQALAAQGKTDQAEAAKKRFEKAWSRADVTLNASRF